MPNVKGKKFSYSKSGKAAAKKYAKKIGEKIRKTANNKRVNYGKTS